MRRRDGFDAENLRIGDHIDRKRQSSRIKDRCASGASRPPQGLLNLQYHAGAFYPARSPAFCLLLSRQRRTCRAEANNRHVEMSIFSLTFITMAKDYCLKVKSCEV